jgi:2,3-dihydroxybenzoate-AMP ligase
VTGPAHPAWPPALAARYRDAGYWLDRPLGHSLRQWAEAYAERPALTDGARRLSHRELAGRAEAVALGLRRSGLERGDRVLVQLPNDARFAVFVLGCLRASVVPVLALTAHRGHELGYLARHAAVRLIAVPDRWRGFDHAALAREIAGGLPWPCEVLTVDGEGGHEAARAAELDLDPPHPDDLALLLLSGGTTGEPKMIPRTHNDYEYNFRRSAQVCGFGPDTVCLIALPAGHNAMLGSPGILGALAAGGTVVMAPSPNPRTVFETIARERVTTTAVVPAVLREWLAYARTETPDLSSLRTIQVGGSIVPAELIAEAEEVLGVRVQQLFGMAEGLLCFTRLGDPAGVTRGTQGRPMCPDDELLVVDESDLPVPRGAKGELLTRGPYTPRGYYLGGAHNARAYTPDGWYRTGDLVRLDQDGNLVVLGRRKDLVNRGGEKISCDEVEVLALDLLPVTRAAALALPDPKLGESLCLVVVPSDPAAAPTLDQVVERFAECGVARFKFPQRLAVLADLPLTPIGKVDKNALSARILEETKA